MDIRSELELVLPTLDQSVRIFVRLLAATLFSGVWLTAAIGVAAGMGMLSLAAISAAFAWVVLAVLSNFDSNN